MTHDPREGFEPDDWVDAMPPAPDAATDAARRAALLTYLLEMCSIGAPTSHSPGRHANASILWEPDPPFDGVERPLLHRLAFEAFDFFDRYVDDRFAEDDPETGRVAAWSVHAAVLEALLEQLGTAPRRFRDGPSEGERADAGAWAKLPGKQRQALRDLAGRELAPNGSKGPHDLIPRKPGTPTLLDRVDDATFRKLLAAGLIERTGARDRHAATAKAEAMKRADMDWADFLERERPAGRRRPKEAARGPRENGDGAAGLLDAAGAARLCCGRPGPSGARERDP